MDRQRLVAHLAQQAPLSFVAGTSALAAWSSRPQDGICIKSKTGRRISFYVGPARRYFGDPNDPLKRGRGRIAVILRRDILQASGSAIWDFAPFDVGEVLYHWVQGSLPEAFMETYSPYKLKQTIKPISGLGDALLQVLSECYEDPFDYFRPGMKPRPSLEIEPLVNAVYRAATARWYGRVRSFSGSVTFEVRCDRDVIVRDEDVVAILVVNDNVTRAANAENFFDKYSSKIEYIQSPATISHPDLASNLLESRSTELVIEYLKSQMESDVSNASGSAR